MRTLLDDFTLRHDPAVVPDLEFFDFVAQIEDFGGLPFPSHLPFGRAASIRRASASSQVAAITDRKLFDRHTSGIFFECRV
jgi:hypothetical protein